MKDIDSVSLINNKRSVNGAQGGRNRIITSFPSHILVRLH